MSYAHTLQAPSWPRAGRLARLGTRCLAVAAVVGITLLGNLRLQASEVRRPTAVTTSGDSRVFARAQALTELETSEPMAARPGSTVQASMDAADAEPAADADNDAARVVPAIYAWDPDVRFVYFRHVSKWM